MWSIRQTRRLFHLFPGKRSQAQRAYERQFSKFSLVALQRWQFLLFRFGKYRFDTEDWFQEQRISLLILSRFIRVIFGPAPLAVALVDILECIERLLLNPSGSFWHFALSLGLMHQLKLLLNHLGITLSKMQLDNSTYVSLASTVAQIAGVFLGLYFTSVGVVASSVYSHVPGDVRALLIQEKMGNLYLRIVALLCAVAVLLLAIHALGFQIGILNLSLLTFLSMVSIFSFIELGRRIFDFFNPAVLVAYLNGDLQKSIRYATSRGFQWHNPSFQRAYQNQAENLLNSYHNIVYFVTHEEHPYGKTLLALARNALSLLVYYEKNKTLIPSESYWFRQTYQHLGWLTSEYERIKLALHSGTGLQPKIVPDPLWFEATIEEIIIDIVQTLLEKNDLRNAVALIDSVRLTVNTVATQSAVEEAIHLQALLQPIILTYAQKKKSDSTPSDTQIEPLRLELSLIELSSLMPINILLGFSRCIQSMSVEGFADSIANIKWSRLRNIYTTELPRPVIEKLEYLQKRLELERSVEGHIISPAWFCQQISALGMARFLSTSVEQLVYILELTYPIQAETLLKENQILLAAQLIQTGVEACEKYKAHFEGLKDFSENLISLRRVADVPYVTVDWDTVEERVRSVKKQLVLSLAKIISGLWTLPQSKHWQDYFGFAYSVLFQEAYNAMAMGDQKLFQRIIPAVFNACLSAESRIADQLNDIDSTMQFIYSTEPYEDILELSGYAIIFSELDGKSYWETIKGLWNQYFTVQPNPQEEVDRILKIVRVRESWPSMYPREMMRTTLRQNFEGQLRKQGLLDDSHTYELHENKQKKHSSAIIRALIRTDHWKLFDNPMNVFLAVYSRQVNTTWQIKLSGGSQSFADKLRREEVGENAKDKKEP